MRKGNRSERRAARAANQTPTAAPAAEAAPSTIPATPQSDPTSWSFPVTFLTPAMEAKKGTGFIGVSAAVSARRAAQPRVIPKPQSRLATIAENISAQYGQFGKNESQSVPASAASAPKAATVAAAPIKDNPLIYSGPGYRIPPRKFKGKMDKRKIIKVFDEQVIAAAAEGFSDLTMQFPHYEDTVFNPYNVDGPTVTTILEAWCPSVGGFNRIIKGFNGYRVIFEEEPLMDVVQAVHSRQNLPFDKVKILQAADNTKLLALAGASAAATVDTKAAPQPLPAAGAAAVAARRVRQPSVFTFENRSTGLYF